MSSAVRFTADEAIAVAAAIRTHAIGVDFWESVHLRKPSSRTVKTELERARKLLIAAESAHEKIVSVAFVEDMAAEHAAGGGQS